MADTETREENTKTRLIRAAGEVFARDGFRSATVREICRRAGAHLGAINYHFRDKEGLYAAVIDYSHRSAVATYPADAGLPDNASPQERLRCFIRAFLSRLLDEGIPAWHGQLMAREIAAPTGALGQLAQGSIRSQYTVLVDILADLLDEGRVTPGQESERLFLSAMSIVGQCLHHFTARRVIAALRPQSFDPADIERIADHITRFSLGGLRGCTAATR